MRHWKGVVHERGSERFRGNARAGEVFETLVTYIADGRWQQASDLYAENVVVYDSTDPEFVTAEFRFVGTARDGARFDRPVGFVLQVRDGLIIESHDYMGPRRALPATSS